MNNELIKLIETQINKELESSYLYLNIANFYASKALDGFASWFRKQAHEEIEHAEKFIKFLGENEIAFKLFDVTAHNEEFSDLKEPLHLQLKHEKYVTSLITAIMDKAVEVKDYAAISFLKWFIDEQVEEELNAKELIDKIEILGTEGLGLYQLNKELAKR